MELTLDQALQKGIEAHRAGQVQDAERLYTAIIKTQPKHPDANHNLGVLAVGVGKLQDALPFLTTALKAKPSVAQFWLSYIDALAKLDRVADAEAVFAQAKNKGFSGGTFDQLEKQLTEQRLKENKASSMALESPASSKTSINFSKNKQALIALQSLGGGAIQDPPSNQMRPIIKLYKKGQLKQALSKINQMLKKFPNSVVLYNIGGAANVSLMRFDAAIDSYQQALKIKPDCAKAYNNMGIALITKGDLIAAIQSYTLALKIKPDYAEAYQNMANAINGLAFTKPNVGMQKIITSILNRKIYINPKDLSKPAISLLKCEPFIKELYEKNYLGEVPLSLERLVSNLCGLPLLLKLMSVCPLADLELEIVLSDVRSALLSSISEISSSPEVLRFQSALALQCFTNEYIYNQTEEETQLLCALEIGVEKSFSNGQQPTPESILCLASYKALNSYKWSDLLTLTSSIEEVIERQIIEPKRELQLKSGILVLQDISNKVSSKVRQQYEKSPYPRWVDLGLTLNPKSIHRVTEELKMRLLDKTINNVLAPNILIAGCGTGQQSISTAARFKNAKVLAVDLSLSSLAYGKRKTEELGFENIDYMQADILDLGKLDRKFHVIESGGVLHHMDEPISGWRVLKNCLEPGGLMKIGLYSELARQHIVRMREEIDRSGIGSSDLAIKSFRSKVSKSEAAHHKLITLSPDFYSLSTLRDLLFHVQEHRFTIPQIQICLDDLGLKFCGFEANHHVIKNFKLTNTEVDDPYDLVKWHSYEQANPRSFAGMYQFWCQKVL